jgi:hypothetical protein
MTPTRVSVATYRTTRTIRRLLTASLLATITACGTTRVVGPERTVQVTLTEYRVTPQRIIAQSGPITFLVHNFGRLAHNLAVTLGGKVVAETSPIRPGSSAVLTVDLSRGSYIIASNLFDDQTLGAYGTLDVSGR